MLHAETAPAELVYGESSYMVGKAQVVLITLTIIMLKCPSKAAIKPSFILSFKPIVTFKISSGEEG